MWWIIVLTGILIVVIYILFAPFFLEIDSEKGLAQVRFHRIAKASLVFRNEAILIQLTIGRWKKEFDLLKQTGKQKPVAKIKTKKQKSFSATKTWKKMKEIIKSFRVNKCQVNIDTGDMPLNGILYPWFYLLSRRTGKTIMINFYGENTITLQLENSIARMLWALVKS